MLNIRKIGFSFLIMAMISSSFGIQAYAASDADEISTLLKSELNLVVSEDKLNNLSSSKQTEIQSLLSMVKRGRMLFSGETPAENTLGVITKLIELELDKNTWDVVLGSILELTRTPVSKAKDLADKSTQVFLSASAIVAMQAIPRERLVFEYIQSYRLEGLSDEEAWKSMLNKYNSSETELSLVCNPNALITGDGYCERAITIQRGGESLHVYAQLAYESFNLAQKLSDNPQYKEALKQKILSDIDEANKAAKEKPNLLSRIWEFVTRPFVFLANKVTSLFSNTGTNTELTAQISDATKEEYQECPAYIFVIAEQTNEETNLAVVRDNFNSLAIGAVEVKTLVGNDVLISVRGDDTLALEATRQKISQALNQLGLQETRMDGTGSYRAKTCISNEDFLKGQNPLPPEKNFGGDWKADWQSIDNQSGYSDIKIYTVQQLTDSKGIDGILLSGEGTQYFGNKITTFKVSATVIGEEITLYQYFNEIKDTVTYKGTISVDRGNGTWTNTLGSSGTWSMIRK